MSYGRTLFTASTRTGNVCPVELTLLFPSRFLTRSVHKESNMTRFLLHFHTIHLGSGGVLSYSVPSSKAKSRTSSIWKWLQQTGILKNVPLLHLFCFYDLSAHTLRQKVVLDDLPINTWGGEEADLEFNFKVDTLYSLFSLKSMFMY